MHLNLTNTTYSSNDKHQGDTRKWAEILVKLNTNVKTVLEEANVDGSLDDFVFVKAQFRLVANGVDLYKLVSSSMNEKAWHCMMNLV